MIVVFVFLLVEEDHYVIYKFLCSTIPEDGRRKAYVDVLEKSKAEEGARAAAKKEREAFLVVFKNVNIRGDKMDGLDGYGLDEYGLDQNNPLIHYNPLKLPQKNPIQSIH